MTICAHNFFVIDWKGKGEAFSQKYGYYLDFFAKLKCANCGMEQTLMACNEKKYDEFVRGGK